MCLCYDLCLYLPRREVFNSSQMVDLVISWFALLCDVVHFFCLGNTGRYLLIALLLSTVTMLSQTAFQLYGIFAEPVDESTLAACKWSC